MTPFAVIVPARRDSSRLPQKALADIGGVPMLVRTLQQAARSGAAQVFAAVDSEDLAEIAEKAGFAACRTGECDSGTARAAAAAEKLNLPEKQIIVNVQADEPFIEPEIIRNTAELLAFRSECVCATAVRPPRDAEEFYEPAAVKAVADADGMACYFSRAPIPYPRNSQNGGVPECARIHLGIYAYTRAFLRAMLKLSPSPAENAENLEQLRLLWHGHAIALLECNSKSFGVDTPDDLAKARARAAQ